MRQIITIRVVNKINIVPFTALSSISSQRSNHNTKLSAWKMTKYLGELVFLFFFRNVVQSHITQDGASIRKKRRIRGELLQVKV